MKKIMIVFAAVVCAVVANAATVNWQSGTIYVAGAANGTTGTTKANTGTALVTAYLFALTAGDYATASGMSTAALYTEYITGAVTPTGTKTTSALGAANISQTVADASGTQYGLVIYVDTVTADSYVGVDAFVKVGLSTVAVGASGTYSASSMALQQTNWTPMTSSVPEPTSGLMLLLGMAGLALKRKNA